MAGSSRYEDFYVVAMVKTCNLRPIKVGSFCSGMKTESMALEKIGVPHTSTFTVEIDKKMQDHIKANFDVEYVLDDVCCKEFVNLPTTDVLTGGFPCQPFSLAGLHQGHEDEKGRGRVIEWVIKHIKHRHPKSFILENVKGLVHGHSEFFNWILKELEGIKDSNGKKAYNVHWEILNSKDFQVPQNRPRVYIVGQLRKYAKTTFSFPKPLGEKKLKTILGKPSDKKIFPTAAGAKRRLGVAKEMIKKKVGANKQPIVIDYGSIKPAYRVNQMPCITARRGGECSYYITTLRRSINLKELIRAQGMDPNRIKQVTNDSTLGKAVGNAWSQPVVEEILKKLLPSIGLTPKLD